MSSSFRCITSIPVLRMYDESRSIDFYSRLLGYSVDWQHRFRDDPTSPLYVQVSQGGSTLHLNGHATDKTPATEVRIAVEGLSEFCLALAEHDWPDGEKPEAVDPRGEGRKVDLNLIDPAGNFLTFWEKGDD